MFTTLARSLFAGEDLYFPAGRRLLRRAAPRRVLLAAPSALLRIGDSLRELRCRLQLGLPEGLRTGQQDRRQRRRRQVQQRPDQGVREGRGHKDVSEDCKQPGTYFVHLKKLTFSHILRTN